MDPHTSLTHDGRRIAPVYLIWGGEMLLDSPIKDAWLHVIDYRSWQDYSFVQHCSGQVGQEGEIVLLKKGELPPYLARTIKLDREHRIVWKTYPQQRTEENDFFGIVDFTLHQIQGGTRFGYGLVFEFLVPYRDESELDAFRTRQYEDTEALFATILPRLKTLAENRSSLDHGR